MKVRARAIGGIVLVGMVAGACAGVAGEREGVEAAEVAVPMITHENLYQIKELVEQGADPNAHYFLFDGLP